MTSKGLWQPKPNPSSASSSAHQGPRHVGQWLYLKPEAVDAYKKCHAEVWPEVLTQIRESGVRDCEFYGFFFVSFTSFQSTWMASLARYTHGTYLGAGGTA